MHIGFLTPEYVTPQKNEGGLANYLRKVSLALVERGHEVSILLLSNRNSIWQDGEVYVCEVNSFQWPRAAKRIQRLRFLLPVTAQILSAKRLRTIVWQRHWEKPFDLLQASSFMAPGYALRQNKEIPLVCRISSYTPLWRSAYGVKRKLADLLSDWLEVRQVLDADAAFAPSYLLSETFSRLEGLHPAVIRTPLDTTTQLFDASYFEQHFANCSYLLYFGTLSRIKGADLLAEILPTVLERHPLLSIVFIGRDDGIPGKGKAFSYIQAYCAAYGQRVQYHQPLPKAQLYPVIANAVGVLMPSRVDNYPNACIEALSLGVPVIGTYGSSLDEMIADGVTGFLAKNEDAADLLAAIDRLLCLPLEQRQQMKNAALDEARKINAEDRVAQLLAFYSDVIQAFKRKKVVAPMISVVVCTYNRADLLAEVLHTLSLQAVASASYEILVIDNNSTDHTCTVIEQQKSQYPNIRYVLEPQVGLSHARNRGWQEAQGEYVAYVDDDCRIPPQWLAVAQEIILTQKPAVFGGPYYAFFNTHKPKWFKNEYGSYEHAAKVGPMQENRYLHGGNMIIRRSLLAELGGFRSDLGMAGNTIAYGEETALQIHMRQIMPEQIIYYDPRLYVYHLVAARKMRWRWIVRECFSGGRDGYRVFQSERVTNSGRCQEITAAIRIIKNLVVDLIYHTWRRDKARFPFPENYWYEHSTRYIRKLGKLYAQVQVRDRQPIVDPPQSAQGEAV